MESVCAMVNCYNYSDNSTSIHFFPFPQNFYPCMKWVQNCGKPEFFEEFTYGGAQPFTNKVICSDHFCRNDFIDPDCASKGLKEQAVPLLNILKIDLKEENEDEYADNNIGDSEDNSFIKPKEEIGFDEKNQVQADLSDVASNNSEKVQLVDNSYLPLLIVLEDRDGNDSVTQKSQRAFQAAWKRALESTEERDARNRANALRNAFKRANETEEERKARNLANAYRRSNETEEQRKERNSANASRNTCRRANETEEQRRDRLYKNAVRAAVRRSMETEAEQEERRRRNALRAAYRRSVETEVQKEQRRLKDKMRSAERRKQETELQSKIRKYNDAVRAAVRRDNQSEDEKQQRRLLDVIRAARRRSNESLEQRRKRLKAERERAAKRRLLKKLGVANAQDVFSNKELKSCLNDLELKSGNNSFQHQSTKDELRHLSYENDTNSSVKREFSESIENRSLDLSDQNSCSSDNIKNNMSFNSDSLESNLRNTEQSTITATEPEIMWCK